MKFQPLRTSLAAVAAVLLIACSPAGAAEAKHVPVGFEVLEHLDLLPLLKDGVVCLQHSSYDRTGGNDDGFSRHVHGTCGGPTRASSSSSTPRGRAASTASGARCRPEGYVKFYFDGEPKPRVQCNFREHVRGQGAALRAAVDGPVERRLVQLLPHPLRQALHHRHGEADGLPGDRVPQVPRRDAVETFSPTLTPEQQQACDAVQASYADPAKREVEANLR